VSLALVGPGHMAYERDGSPFVDECRDLDTGRQVVARVIPLTAMMLVACGALWPEPEPHNLDEPHNLNPTSGPA